MNLSSVPHPATDTAPPSSPGVRILGIETSCDETSAAVVADGRRILGSVVASQVDLHAAFGGVVPELASRAHVQQIGVIIRQALDQAGMTLRDIDAVAVTARPGLIGALLVGVETAKGLCLAADKPLIAVHHVRAHLYSPFLDKADGTPLAVTLARPDGDEEPTTAACPLRLPCIGLAISGGHSSLALVHSPLDMVAIGETRDDAVGEAYDKVAKLVGLGYPGGPIVDRLAAEGDPSRYELPRPMIHSDDLDFSFSGLKTAVRTLFEHEAPPADHPDRDRFVRDLCSAFQEAVIAVLLRKTVKAAQRHKLDHVSIVGGVACNRGLRQACAALGAKGLTVVAPPPALCGDNAAMIAGLGYHHFAAGHWSDLSLNPSASHRL